MPIYILFRWFPSFYEVLYRLIEKNHNEKIVHKYIARFLSFWDKFFLIIPLLFVAYINWPNNIPFIANGHVVLGLLIGIPYINTAYKIFNISHETFCILSLFLYFFSALYKNAFNAHKNESLFAKDFHHVCHGYRDFVNTLILRKQELGIFEKYGETKKEAWDSLRQSYSGQINELCTRAQWSMASLINDKDCYVSFKIIQRENSTNKVVHVKAFPDNHRGQYLTKLDLNSPVGENPGNLFEEILKKFEKEKVKPHETWNFGKICNDLKGEKFFNKSLIGNRFDRYKSCIILPITYDYGLNGFLCFNSKKVGYFRKKHKNHLAGFCDKVAILLRNIDQAHSVDLATETSSEKMSSAK